MDTMADFTPSQLDGYAREAAGQISTGYSIDQVASSLNLSAGELEYILDSGDFEAYLESYGDSVVEAFKETRADTRASSFKRKISDRFDIYYEELHSIAMNKSVKIEKRADVLLTLMKYVAPTDTEITSSVQMPPALIENWARRMAEYETAKEAGLTPNSPDGVGDTSPGSIDGEGESVLLRERSDADGGSDPGATPTVRELSTTDTVGRRTSELSAKATVDAERSLQVFPNLGRLPPVAFDPRSEHLDSSDLIQGSKHQKVAGGDP